MGNPKAKAWVEGRKHQMERIEQELAHNTSPLIWVHSASTGEFEQAKPVIESLLAAYPLYKVVATFFSPSGYEAAAKYAHIHYRYYLPEDTAANAQQFVQLVQPKLAIFSKYDFWHHHLSAIRTAGAPLLLISSIFRPSQLFFRWYGGFYRRLLQQFTHIFVQDVYSLRLLRGIGISHASVGGDTRFDRVAAIATARANNPITDWGVYNFIQNRPCFVAGSTWPDDEALIASLAQAYPQYCFVVVPHEIGITHIAGLQQRFPNALLYSDLEHTYPIRPLPNPRGPLWTGEITPESELLEARAKTSNVLIVDAMGKLATLYAMAQVTYVGGGFNKSGIHNTLEAAVWGKPVIIGPNYQKFREARELVQQGGAFSIQTAEQLRHLMATFIHDKAALQAASDIAKNYVAANAGATTRIMEHIQSQGWLSKDL